MASTESPRWLRRWRKGAVMEEPDETQFTVTVSLAISEDPTTDIVGKRTQAQATTDGPGTLETVHRTPTAPTVVYLEGEIGARPDGLPVLDINLHTLDHPRDAASLGWRILAPTLAASGAAAFPFNHC